MKPKVNKNDVFRIDDMLFEKDMSVQSVSEYFGYAHPSIFIKRLRALGYDVRRALRRRERDVK